MITKTKKTAKLILLVFTLLLINEVCEAKKTSGYIITNDKDTIRGTIRLYTFNRRDGGFNLHNISLEMCFVEIPFRKSDQKKYTIYKPDAIKGYGFTYKGVPYEFSTFLIESKSLSLNDKKQNHFLQYVYNQNNNKVYRHQTYVSKDAEGNLEPKYIFYIYNAEKGITKINQ